MRARIVTISSFALVGAIGYACCGVGRGPVLFRGQTNVIVWDPGTHTEHFIRSASFETKSKDLGFIAPTPTVPEISEVKKDAILLLDAMRPVPKRSPGGLRGGGFGGSEGEVYYQPVVIQVKEVGGYLATTLKASDVKGLARWMAENEYDTSPAIQAWTKFYIAKNWYLTAFKVINKDGEPSTGVIKMSFKTSRAFNPYFVPADNIPKEGSGRGLSLYFVSSVPHNVPLLPRSSTFRKEWSVPIESETAAILKKQLKIDDFPEGAIAQHFVDPSFPNKWASDDLWFSPSAGGLLSRIAEGIREMDD